MDEQQADYIKTHTGATHIIKIAQSIVARDIALIPVVFNLTTLKVVEDHPFKKVTVLKGGGFTLLNFGSMNNILSTMMRVILPNSFALGPSLNYMRNHRLLSEDIDVEIISGNTELWPSIVFDFNNIYPLRL